MKQKQLGVKGNFLQKIGLAALIVVIALSVLIGLLILPPDDLSLYASHPNPAADYAEAMQRVERLRAAEVGFNPDCHTILLTHGARTAKVILFLDGYGSCSASFQELGKQFFDRGYNVLSLPLPFNGLADRMTNEQAKIKLSSIPMAAKCIIANA